MGVQSLAAVLLLAQPDISTVLQSVLCQVVNNRAAEEASPVSSRAPRIAVQLDHVELPGTIKEHDPGRASASS